MKKGVITEEKSKNNCKIKFTSHDICDLDISQDTFRVLSYIHKISHTTGLFFGALEDIQFHCFRHHSDDRAARLAMKCLKELVDFKILEKEILPKNNRRRYKLLDLSHAPKLEKNTPEQKIEKKLEKKQKEKEKRRMRKEKKNNVVNLTLIKTEKTPQTQKQVTSPSPTTRPQWCFDLGAEWFVFARDVLKVVKECDYNSPIIDKYGMHISDAYMHLLRNHPDIIPENFEFWMKEMFNYIKENRFWIQACPTPSYLLKNHEEMYKVDKIFLELRKGKRGKEIEEGIFSDMIEREYRKFYPKKEEML